eukprot:7390173-Prymnesium_polylepis.1
MYNCRTKDAGIALRIDRAREGGTVAHTSDLQSNYDLDLWIAKPISRIHVVPLSVLTVARAACS